MWKREPCHAYFGDFAWHLAAHVRKRDSLHAGLHSRKSALAAILVYTGYKLAYPKAVPGLLKFGKTEVLNLCRYHRDDRRDQPA